MSNSLRPAVIVRSSSRNSQSRSNSSSNNSSRCVTPLSMVHGEPVPDPQLSPIGSVEVDQSFLDDMMSPERDRDRDAETASTASGGMANLADITDINAAMQVNKLRRKLKFFFLNPVEKYRLTRELPWKLIAQIIKIFLVTSQLIHFGQQRLDHVSFMEDTQTVLRHILLGNWSEIRDVKVWPPSQGPYAVYTDGGMQNALAQLFNQYYILNTTTFSAITYDYQGAPDYEYPPMDICLHRWRSAQVNPSNGTYEYDLRVDKICAAVSLNATQREELQENYGYVLTIMDGFDMNLEDATRMNEMVLVFRLKTIRGQGLLVRSHPACFDIELMVHFDNMAHTGMVKIDVTSEMSYSPVCKGHVIDGGLTPTPQWMLLTLDLFVIVTCLFSFVLCSRALVRAALLEKKTVSYFKNRLKRTLSNHDKLEFLNLWYVMIVINDCMIVAGTLVKMDMEYSDPAPDAQRFTTASLMLGSGTLLVWSGILRYLGFFSQYNILILTIKKALPNVLRFLVCAAFLYVGFMFWGWVVIGPYSAKFRTLFLSFSNMFALINGDDMFATFFTLSEKTPTVVLIMSRVYLVCFLSLFIYVVLSLFISIIMDAYEIVKERLQPDDTIGALRAFVEEDQTPLMRMARMDRQLSMLGPLPIIDVPGMWQRVKDTCCGCCPASNRRRRTQSMYSEIGANNNQQQQQEAVNERSPLID